MDFRSEAADLTIVAIIWGESDLGRQAFKRDQVFPGNRDVEHKGRDSVRGKVSTGGEARVARKAGSL